MRKLQNVTIEITTKCNFNCKHCCNESGTIKKENLTKEEILNIIDEMCVMGVERLGITGGEPFCDENLFTYIEYAKTRIPVISIATNGYLINEEIVKRLKENDVNKIAISLDGMKDYHDAFRGNNEAYDHVVRAIDLLSESGMEIKVRSVLTKYNVDSILKLMDITNNLNIKRHEILPVCPIGRASNSLILSREEYKKFLITAIEKIRSFQRPNITFQLKPVFYQEDLFQNVDECCKEKSLTYKCDALDTSLEISSNGDVLGCSFVRIPVGNIKFNSLSDIWNSKEAIKLHHQIFNHNKEGECTNCKDNEKCNGGCYANRLYGDGGERDVYCFVKRRS
jgi:radical SAM protein with 4Fe4S-binding SPASM domain